jgi:hypothetical protein
MLKNSLGGLVSQSSLAAGRVDKIELLRKLVGKTEIEDTEENRMGLAEAYKEDWRERKTQQRLAEFAVSKDNG